MHEVKLTGELYIGLSLKAKRALTCPLDVHPPGAKTTCALEQSDQILQ